MLCLLCCGDVCVQIHGDNVIIHVRTFTLATKIDELCPKKKVNISGRDLLLLFVYKKKLEICSCILFKKKKRIKRKKEKK